MGCFCSKETADASICSSESVRIDVSSENSDEEVLQEIKDRYENYLIACGCERYSHQIFHHSIEEEEVVPS